MTSPDAACRLLQEGEFILGDAGFALPVFISEVASGFEGNLRTVRCTSFSIQARSYMFLSYRLKRCLGFVLFVFIIGGPSPVTRSLSKITLFREVDMKGPNVASMPRFNHLHAKMRVGAENDFRGLKGRWHMLRAINAHPELPASMQEVCVALHNAVDETSRRYDSAFEEEADTSQDSG